MRGHATTHVVRRRGSRAVGSADSGVVLGPTPGEANARVTNRVTLHLVNRHFSRMAVNELHEAAALARWDLDISNLPESLKERAKLVLSDISRETANEHSSVVGVCELVHGLHRVECSALAVERGGGSPHRARMAGNRRHHLIAAALALAAVLVRAAAG